VAGAVIDGDESRSLIIRELIGCLNDGFLVTYFRN
jgi:hypothetical protein